MGLDEEQLDVLLAAQDRHIEAEQTANRATEDFHRTVCRLQVAGVSVRDLGVALGLSHQRVHQMVQKAAVGGRSRPRSASGLVACSFCGLKPGQVKELIAADGAYICDGCIGIVEGVLASGDPSGVGPQTVRHGDRAHRRRRCNFCGERRSDTDSVISADERLLICAPCVTCCGEALKEEWRPSESEGMVK